MVSAGETWRIDVDAAIPAGTWRALHGINKGPLAPGGIVNVIDAQRVLHLPWTRLHDCHWPVPDVVDMHVVFPNAAADPALAASYDFRRTDRYLAAVRETGAGIVYRLGESIEHEPDPLHVHPPKDPERWAQACLGIIRHYNEGWAEGTHFAIPYWEIWNEPENRPVMWTGNDAEFFTLYATASKTIKAQFPNLKIGGPAIGNSGEMIAGEFHPSAFLQAFLSRCQQEQLPLDFFSWHCYTSDPTELASRARAIRALLDEHGFQRTESHLNEWNFLPANSWEGLTKSATPQARAAAYDAMSGPPGAAFVAAGLMTLQTAPVDVANLFHGECGGFGLFTDAGVATASYHAVRLFSELRETPALRQVISPLAITALAGFNESATQGAVLLSIAAPGPHECLLSLRHFPSHGEGELVISRHDVQSSPVTEARVSLHEGTGELPLNLTGPGVWLLKFRALE